MAARQAGSRSFVRRFVEFCNRFRSRVIFFFFYMLIDCSYAVPSTEYILYVCMYIVTLHTT